MTPLVSLCVPTIGRADYLPALVQAIDAQTFRDVEILVLDNASPPDVVAAHFEPWARRDPRVRLLRCEPRIPMFSNFNRGIAEARGRYLAFFHDDDVQAPTLLEASVDMLERHPHAGFCGTNYDFIDERSQVTETRRWIARDEVVLGRVYIEDLVSRGRNLVTMPGLVYRRDAVRDGFDERLPIHFGDFTFLMRIAERYDVALLRESLVAIRRHSGQAGREITLSQSLPLRKRVFCDYLEEFESRHPDERAAVRRLRRRLTVTLHLGLAYAWLAAEDSAEAQACAREIGRERATRVFGTILRELDELGVRSRVRGPRATALARKIAPLLRL